MEELKEKYSKFTKVLMEKFFEEVKEEYLDSFIKGLKFGIKLAEGKDEDFAFCYGVVLGYFLGKEKLKESKNYESSKESL